MEIWDTVSVITKQLTTHVRPGVTTLTLNNVARQLMKEHNVASAVKESWPRHAKEPYPYEIFVSVNDEIAQGIPSDRKLKEGDTVNLDISIVKDERYASSALTLPVGTISEGDAELLHYAKKSLYEGIKRIQHGIRVEVVARAIEEMAWWKKYVVNCSFTSSGIGANLQEEPIIYNARNPYYDNPEMAVAYQKYMNIELQAGQVICLQPAITKIDKFGIPDDNGWTWRTRNRAKSANYKEMVRVEEDGFTILTSHLKEEHEKYLG